MTEEKKSCFDKYREKYCIIRTYSAGVFVGYLNEIYEDGVTIKNARQLWYWENRKGIALTGTAEYGLKKNSKLCTECAEIAVRNAIEIIPVKESLIEEFREFPVYNNK